MLRTLWITGLRRARRFVDHHRVLNRAAWSPRAAARLLPGLLVEAFAPDGPVVLGLDDTIERRRGRRIGTEGIYRDPVRSSHGHFVKASGLRWLSLLLLAPIPWAGRVWALPFLTALVPSERSCRERGRRHGRSPIGRASCDRWAAASTAWYRKPRPTFSDTLAAVRRHSWCEQGLLPSRRNGHATKPRPALQTALVHALCHAA